MEPYTRPDIAEQLFRDDFGTVIPYGTGMSVHSDDDGEGTNAFTNQGRYSPIFTVAEALVDYLAKTYEVDVVEDSRLHAPSGEVWRTVADCDRIVKVEPVSSTQPPIWIGFSSAPGHLCLAAGCFAEFDMWFCGCDTCDEPWTDIADSLESVVLAIAKNGLHEWVDRRPWGRARYSLESSESRGSQGSVPKSMLRSDSGAAAIARVSKLPRGSWEGFTPRAAS